MDNHRLKIIAVLVVGFAALAVAANSPYYGVKPDETAGTAEGHISGKWGVAASSQTADNYTITLDGPAGKGTFYTVESGTVSASHVQATTVQAGTAAVTNSLTVGQSASVGANATIGGNANIGGNTSVTGNISAQGNLSVQGTGNITGAFTGSTGTFNNALGVGITPTARLNVHNGNMVMTGVSVPFQFPSTTKMNLNLNTSFTDALGAWGGSSGGSATISSGESRFGGGSAFFQLYRGLRQSWTDNYKFNPTAEFTLTFWAKRLSNDDAFFFYWIAVPNEYNWFSFEWRYNNNSPYFTMHIRDWYSGTSTQQTSEVTQRFTANEWHYIVLQYNHTNARKTTVWIDGVRLACSGHTSGGSVSTYASGFINIGGMTDVRGWWGNTSAGFYGYMDEIRFDHVARYDYNAANVPVPTMEWGTPTINTMLGIHTSNPQARLHIGNVDSKMDQILVEGGRHSIFNQSGGVGINVGTVEPNAKLDVVADAQYPYILRVSSTAQSNLPILSVSTGTLFVGIRKANPQTELDVNGTVKTNLLSATTAQVSLLQSATVQAALVQATTGQFSIMNATSAIQFNGANINIAGTLGNVAYRNQDNGFTAAQTFQSSMTVLTDFEAKGTANAALLSGATVYAGLAQATTGQFDMLNVTGAIMLTGADINSTGALGNVAYKGQDNNFTAPQTFQSSVTAKDISADSVKAGTGMFTYMGIGGATVPEAYVVDITTNASIPLGAVLHVENTYPNQTAIAARGSDNDGMGVSARAKTAFGGSMHDGGAGLSLTQDPNSSHVRYIRANLTGYGTDLPIYDTYQYTTNAVSSDVYHAEMGANGLFTGKFINFISSGTVRFTVDNTGAVYAADTITTVFGVNASTITVPGVAILGGATFHGAKTHAELQMLACETIPCMAVSSDSPYELFVATGTEAGQWQGQTSGGGP